MILFSQCVDIGPVLDFLYIPTIYNSENPDIPVTLGIAALTIQGKEKLREQGICIWDLADLGFVQ